MSKISKKSPNLERELKSADWIVEKVKTRKSYAQNLYAALCNMKWQKLEVIPLLKEEFWHCSWRYSGEIIADVIGEGSYLDWYCSGLWHDDFVDEKFKDNEIVTEGIVTEEVAQDLKKLGWIAVEWED